MPFATLAAADWRVLNRGVNGERSDQIRARFTRDVVDASPDVVVIVADARDQRRDPRLRGAASGPRVVCDTRAAVAAPGRPDQLVSSPDGLHPSPQGYKLMAEALEPAIARALTLTLG